MSKRVLLVGLVAALWLAAVFLFVSPFGLSRSNIERLDLTFADTEIQRPFYGFAHEGPIKRAAFQGFDRREAGTYRRFYAEFDEPITQKHALYIPDAGGEFHVFINSETHSRSDFAPLFSHGFSGHVSVAVLKRRNLTPGKNRADIFLADDNLGTGLRAVYFGETQRIDALRARYNQKRIWVRAIGSTALAALFLVSLLGLLFTPAKGVYGYGMLLSGGGALLQISGIISELSPAVLTPSVLHGAAFLGILISLWGLHSRQRYKAMELSVAEQGLYLAAVTGVVFALIYPFWPLPVSSPVLLAWAMILPLGYGLWLVMRHVALDYRFRLTRLKALEQTVSSQIERLDERTKYVVKEIRKRSLMEERERFTRDIHDGIGGRLLGLLLQVRSGDVDQKEIVQEIQGSLNDLRLVVDAMDHMGDDLDAVLKTFRDRTQPQMKSAGLAYLWNDNAPPGLQLKKPGMSLHLYRLLQEALTNIVRHAKAKTVTIETRLDAQKNLILLVKDDGIGLPETQPTEQGKGLPNMKKRALDLGATLQIGSAPGQGGTQISLIFPAKALEFNPA